MRFVCPACRGIISNDGLKSDEEFVQCGHCDEIVKIPTSRLSPGAVVGDFIIEREIGRGGMGVVFLSHQISLDRPAALKVLQDSYSQNANFVVSFIREARAAAKLNHPHIVQAYAVGEDNGVFYFAMEFIEGETMKHVLAKEHKISCERALPIIQQVVEALDCAWKEAKLVHRDIKPDNIMLASADRVKLADLGLSQKAGEMDDADSDEVMGTPQYISPEHLTGAPMDNRSDIYSLGATFYQFVTGEFPFKGNNPNEIARKHLEEPLVPPREINPEVPQNVNDIIVRMMQKNPEDRYQTTDELLDVLREARRSLPTASASTASGGNRKISLSIGGKKIAPSAPAAAPSPQVPPATEATEAAPSENNGKINLRPPTGGAKITLNRPGKSPEPAAPPAEATAASQEPAVPVEAPSSTPAAVPSPALKSSGGGLKLKGSVVAEPESETAPEADDSEDATGTEDENSTPVVRKNIDKQIMLGAAGFLFVVIVGAVVWFFVLGKGGDNANGNSGKNDGNTTAVADGGTNENKGSNSDENGSGLTTVAERPVVPKEVVPYTTKSAYAQKVEEVFYFFQKNGSETEFLRNASELFDGRLKPQTAEDKVWHNKLESLVNSITEAKVVAPFRDSLRAKHQEEIAGRMAAFAPIDEYRREQKLKEQVEEKKLVEKEGAGAVQLRKLRLSLQDKRSELVEKMLDYYAEKRIPELRLELKDALMNVGSYGGESRKLVQLHNLAVDNYLQVLESCLLMNSLLVDGSKELKGMQVEVNRIPGGRPEVGLLKSFINGNITVEMDDGKDFYCRIESLQPGQRVEFIKRMERKVNQPNLLFSTLLLTGSFDKINSAIPMTKFWKDHLNGFEYNYLRKKLPSMSPGEVMQAKYRFGRLPAFKKAYYEVFPPSEEEEAEAAAATANDM